MADDTISRVAALTALNGCTEIYLNNLPPTIYKSDAVEAIKALPSAQPTGHWIEDETSNHVEKTFLCSECGFSAWGQYEKTKFCGGCGAKMENPYEEYSEGEQG